MSTHQTTSAEPMSSTMLPPVTSSANCQTARPSGGCGAKVVVALAVVAAAVGGGSGGAGQ